MFSPKLADEGAKVVIAENNEVKGQAVANDITTKSH